MTDANLPHNTYNHARLLNDIEQLFTQARPRLLHLARLNGVIADCAEDVVQETLIEAWRHLDTLREPARFRAWLDGICRNVCRRQKRRDDMLSLHELHSGSFFASGETGEMDVSLNMLDPSTPDPLEELSQQDLATLLDCAMGHLPAPTRQLLEMCYLAEIPQREAALRLELTIGALELRLHRARHQLRQILTGPLRTEAQHFGIMLDPEEAQNWQTMRQWCWLCGKQKVLARFEAQENGQKDLCMRCPECSSRYGMALVHSTGMTSLDDVSTFRPALKRVFQELSKYAPWNATAGLCLYCQGPASIRIFPSAESQAPLPPGRYWISIDCPKCGDNCSDIATLVIAHPAIQRFLIEHERCISEPYRLIEYNGAQVICACLVDLTSAAKLTALIDTQTFRCLATFSE